MQYVFYNCFELCGVWPLFVMQSCLVLPEALGNADWGRLVLWSKKVESMNKHCSPKYLRTIEDNAKLLHIPAQHEQQPFRIWQDSKLRPSLEHPIKVCDFKEDCFASKPHDTSSFYAKHLSKQSLSIASLKRKRILPGVS